MSAVMPSCAVILGLPATQDAFCDTVNPSDYAINQFSGPLEIAWEQYRPSVALAENLAATARRLGSAVYQNGDVNVLRKATSAYGTVVLFAHTRSRAFVDSDFSPPAKLEEVRDRLSRPDIPFASLLNRFGAIAEEGPCALRSALNEAIADRSLLRGLPPEQRPITGDNVLLEQVLCREMLDAAIGTLVVPGNQVELFGSLYDVGVISGAIDPDFRGEMALITCNSAVLATAIELRFGFDVRLASWEIELLPSAYYVIVEIALRRWVEQGGSLLDILRDLEAMLVELAAEDTET